MRVVLANLVFVCFIFTISGSRGSGPRNRITIQDGGYQNILIAINKDVTEDRIIIDNLIDIFSSGSGHLFTATRRRTFWQNITILIPTTWEPKPEYEPARTESFETANVIVDAPNPEWEDNPYTQQLGGCGKHGEYIHLTENYIKDRENSEYIWGPMGKLLTHEWGHLRWGLFDEHHTDDDGVAPFYANSRGKIEATRCTDQINGMALNNNTSKKCKRDPATGLYEADCVYFPDLEGQTSPASIMYGQFLDSVTDYCHSDPGLPGYHNQEAPNKHNNLCSSRSSWDIMLEHEDFLDGNNPPMEGDVDTKPTFRLIQARKRRVAMVLDVSGSMGHNDRLTKLNQAATQYLCYTIDEGSSVGMVHFEEDSQVEAELTEITDDESREILVGKLPPVADGATCIGCGILDGIQVLSGVNRTDDPAGGYILLISDGEENREPYIDDVFDDVETAGVIIDTIAFSDAADPKLLELSARTNGLAFFYPDTANSTALNDAFTATVTSRPDVSSQTLPIQIYSEVLHIPANGQATDTFLIDSSLGLETVLIFSWLDQPISVVVSDPDGRVINSSDTSQYRQDDIAKLIAITITDTATPGLWTFTVDGDSNNAENVLVTIKSKPTSEDDPPITVDAIIGSQTLNHTTTPKLEIFAEVRKGYLPVINAAVQAVIETPGAATTYLPLFDKGAGADITKYDGIYSAYFLEFDANGRYSIKVQVSNEALTASISSRSRRTSRGLPLSPERYTSTRTTYEPAEPFVRTETGGVFEVQNFVAPVGDGLAPSRISDLSVVARNYNQSSVTLQWTAVGDDYDQGTAFEYDLRFATTFALLRDNFTESAKVVDSQLIAGNLSVIGQSGMTETVIIEVPTRGESVAYFFGIIAVDEAGNEGELSNVVSASMEYVPPSLEYVTPSTEYVTPSTEYVASSLEYVTPSMEYVTPSLEYVPPLTNIDTGLEPWAIGVITGVSVLFAVSVVVIVKCMVSSSKNKIMNGNEQKQPENIHENNAYNA